MVYLITYDLNKPGQDYSTLYEGIKGLGSWCHPLDSTWFVVSTLNAAEIRDMLKAQVDSSDQLIVAKVTTPAAWFNLGVEVSQWLERNL